MSARDFQQKTDIVTKICNAVRGNGRQIDAENAWDFLYQYERRFNRLPTDGEIGAIASQFVQSAPVQNAFVPNFMAAPSSPAQDQIAPAYSAPEPEPAFASSINITPTDALKAMVQDIPTMDPKTKKFFIQMIDELPVADQELLVSKIKSVESDLNRIPYLIDDDRLKLRNAVFDLQKDKRREKLAQIIKDRMKNEAFHMSLFTEFQTRKELSNISTISKEDINDIMNVILTLPQQEKKNIDVTVREIETQLTDLKQKGVSLSDVEHKTLRLDLIRLNPKERHDQIDRVLEERKTQMVQSFLYEQIPAMEFENNEKLLKELIWLSDVELKTRIEKIKNEQNKSSEEKSKIFEKSQAGSACKKCGWPMGSFSKKCVRCGWSVDDWFTV